MKMKSRKKLLDAFAAAPPPRVHEITVIARSAVAMIFDADIEPPPLRFSFEEETPPRELNLLRARFAI